MFRKDILNQYMVGLILQYDVLEAERQILLNPQDRLAEVNAQRQELIADAQELLPKYNAVFGTNYTLAQLRAALSPTVAP